MALKIVRNLYVAIRNQFYKLARRWNGINSVIQLNGGSPSWKKLNKNNAIDGRYVPGRKGPKVEQFATIPIEMRETIDKDYSNEKDEINQQIIEESALMHTLGNENYIRDAIIALNNISQQYIGALVGLVKQEIKEKGKKINISLSSLKLKSKNKDVQELFNKNNGVKKYSQLSSNPNDRNLLSFPYQTSAINISDADIKSTDVLTYNVDKNYKLDESEIVKYNDYEEINSVLTKIDKCLAKRNNWFDGNGRCQLSCQVSCQHSCQLSCQGCNRKQCHNQSCGSI